MSTRINSLRSNWSKYLKKGDLDGILNCYCSSRPRVTLFSPTSRKPALNKFRQSVNTIDDLETLLRHYELFVKTYPANCHWHALFYSGGHWKVKKRLVGEARSLPLQPRRLLALLFVGPKRDCHIPLEPDWFSQAHVGTWHSLLGGMLYKGLFIQEEAVSQTTPIHYVGILPPISREHGATSAD